MPTKPMIKKVICQAFAKAIEHMDPVGIKSVSDQFNLCNFSTMSDYTKILFEDEQILDEFSQDDEDMNETFDYQQDDNSDEDGYSFLEYLDDSDGRKSIFSNKTCL